MAKEKQGASSGSAVQVGVADGRPVVTGDLNAVVTPENVTMLVSLIGAAVGVTTTAIKGIQLWVEERKSRKIRVRYRDLEVEIVGRQTEADLASKLAVFESLNERLIEDEVEIEVVGP